MTASVTFEEISRQTYYHLSPTRPDEGADCYLRSQIEEMGNQDLPKWRTTITSLVSSWSRQLDPPLLPHTIEVSTEYVIASPGANLEDATQTIYTRCRSDALKVAKATGKQIWAFHSITTQTPWEPA